ncbi:uncharacterized protein VTP21DRAFT_2023 [Calcarisporiella thermophila]|uniref:uncharacterized protein n=1 Tax=Calcarisporiella thermophila TaxID=911321 RepID=UPI003743C9CE
MFNSILKKVSEVERELSAAAVRRQGAGGAGTIGGSPREAIASDVCKSASSLNPRARANVTNSPTSSQATSARPRPRTMREYNELAARFEQTTKDLDICREQVKSITQKYAVVFAEISRLRSSYADMKKGLVESLDVMEKVQKKCFPPEEEDEGKGPPELEEELREALARCLSLREVISAESGETDEEAANPRSLEEELEALGSISAEGMEEANRGILEEREQANEKNAREIERLNGIIASLESTVAASKAQSQPSGTRNRDEIWEELEHWRSRADQLATENEQYRSQILSLMSQTGENGEGDLEKSVTMPNKEPNEKPEVTGQDQSERPGGSELEQADKQIARLEREVERLRSRLKNQSGIGSPVPGVKSSTESIEISDLQEALDKRNAEIEKLKTEHEEKIKKMKGVFSAANKNLGEMRQTIVEKDQDIERLMTEVNTLRNELDEMRNALDESKAMNKELEFELQTQSSKSSSRIESLESKLKEAIDQQNQIKLEYQQYKKRAHALLNQQAPTQHPGDSRLAQLEEQLRSLEMERLEKNSEITGLQHRLATAERDLQEALAHASGMEQELEALLQFKRQHLDLQAQVEKLEDQIRRDQAEYQDAVEEMEKRHAQTIHSLRLEVERSAQNVNQSLSKKSEQIEELQQISERLGEELSTARSLITKRDEEIEGLRRELKAQQRHNASDPAKSLGGIFSGRIPSSASTSTSDLPPATVENDLNKSVGKSTPANSTTTPPISSRSSSSAAGDLYSSLSELLSYESAPTHPASKSGAVPVQKNASGDELTPSKEREYQTQIQHMTELLGDSDAQVQRLTEQVGVLKSEIRRVDALMKRQQNPGMENIYIKNVLLKFLEAPDREALMPVMTTMLQLSQEEATRLRKIALSR